MKLGGKRALITGATKGIGLSIAHSLAREGVHQVLCARSQQDLERTREELSKYPVHVYAKPCDVGSAEQVDELVQLCASKLGGLDILVNNAGVGVFQSVEEMSIDTWRQIIGTNLDGLFYCCHYALPLLKLDGGGFIINIGSLAGKNAFPKGAAYNASKFGLNGFSEALMQEVRHDDVRVAYIMPGSVDTWFSGHEPEGKESWKLAADDVAQVVFETLLRPSRCLTSRIEMRPSKPPVK